MYSIMQILTIMFREKVIVSNCVVNFRGRTVAAGKTAMRNVVVNYRVAVRAAFGRNGLVFHVLYNSLALCG